jgi:hypothetical protein
LACRPKFSRFAKPQKIKPFRNRLTAFWAWHRQYFYLQQTILNFSFLFLRAALPPIYYPSVAWPTFKFSIASPSVSGSTEQNNCKSISSTREPVYRGWNSGSSSVSALVNAWGRTEFLYEGLLECVQSPRRKCQERILVFTRGLEAFG